MKLIIICCLLFISCSKKLNYEKTNTGKYVKNLNIKISSLEVVDWSVGFGLKRDKVSKGIQFKIKLPEFREKDALSILKDVDANSWIFKINRVKPYKKGSTLAYFYLPFVKKTARSKEYQGARASLAAVRIVYAAAAPSKRFERFKCPAFGHNKLITDVNIEKQDTVNTTLNLYPGSYINGKVEKLSLGAFQIPGGMSLKGLYQIEVALYNSQSKTLKSPFIKSGEIINVKDEEEKTIQGCSDFQIPDRKEEEKKKFKFGR